jgi:hypothetical protein
MPRKTKTYDELQDENEDLQDALDRVADVLEDAGIVESDEGEDDHGNE